MTCLYCGGRWAPRHEETCEALALERVTIIEDSRYPTPTVDTGPVCDGLWMEDHAEDEHKASVGK